jgi:predicted transcriptional regulator
MTNKQLAIEALRDLPNEASFAEIGERIAILAAIRDGEDAADDGRLVANEELKRRVAQWIAQ